MALIGVFDIVDQLCKIFLNVRATHICIQRALYIPKVFLFILIKINKSMCSKIINLIHGMKLSKKTSTPLNMMDHNIDN